MGNEEEMLKDSLEFFIQNHLRKTLTSEDHLRIAIDIFTKYWNRLVKLPASQTGRHHPDIENVVPFGLINHKIRVVYVSQLLCREEGIDNPDDVILAAWFHDLGKIMVKTKEDYVRHGQLSADLTAEKVYDLPNGILIYLIIRNHMSHWCGQKLICTYDRIVAYADFIVTQKEIQISGLKYLDIKMFQDEHTAFNNEWS